MKHIKPEVLEVGDVIRIDHRGKAYLLRTTTLSGEKPRLDTYDAPDEVIYWGTQKALF